MPDQNRLKAYEEAKAEAEARWQQAVHQAQRVFDRSVAAENAAQAARYHAASDAWDAVKSDADAKGFEEARAAFRAAMEPASHEAAYAELDRAVRAADEACRDEIEKLAALHGVTVR